MIRRASSSSSADLRPRAFAHAGGQAGRGPDNTPYFASKDIYQVFVLGDSLAAGLWSGVSRMIDGDMRISLNGRYKEDSGLSRPEYYDWNDALPKILASNQIDIAVVMIGSNDAQAIRDGADALCLRHAGMAGRPISEQVDKLMASLKAAGAAVYWVEMPPMQAAKYDASMKVIAAIHDERAKAAGIRFVETRTALLGKRQIRRAADSTIPASS